MAGACLSIAGQTANGILFGWDAEDKLRIAILTSVVLVLASLAAAQQPSANQATAELFALIDKADEMVVYSEGFKREFVIYRSSNRKDFDALKAAITLRHGSRPFVCACMDEPEIALLRNGTEIATVWNHEGRAIGSSVWKGDWYNRDPNRWLRWFDARDMTFARAFFNEMETQTKDADQAEKRWLKAMPSSLKPLWNNARRQYNPPMSFPDLKPLDAALLKQYPDTYDRIRALLSWFGSGAGPWSGFPGYEEIAAKLLREYPTTDLIKAVGARQLTEEQLEGAARILGSWKPISDPTPIPSELQRTLLEHCLKSSDQDKVERAKKAFSPDK